MNTKEIADIVITLLKEGKFEEITTYWSSDVVGIEEVVRPGIDPVATGIEAMRAKFKSFWENNTLVLRDVDGPYIKGEQFAVRLTSTVTVKETGLVREGVEIALYTTHDGKITEERFFPLQS